MWCDNCLLLLPLRGGAIAWAVVIAAYSLAGGIFLLKLGQFFFFLYPEAQIFGGLSMGIMGAAILTCLALSNRSYIWTRVVRFLWIFCVLISLIRAIWMLIELQRGKEHIIWECNNGGQLWSSNSTASTTVPTDAVLPGGFCVNGFSSINMAFTVGLVIDLVFQMYMFFLTWRYSKRLEHYGALKGPFAGGYYNAY